VEWLADFFGIETIDRFADAWRWWAAVGSLIGLILLRRRFVRLVVALISGRLHMEEKTILPPEGRLLTTGCAMLFMLAAFIGGLVIPFANDGRFYGFTRETVEYRSLIAFIWLLWGCSAWGIALSLAPRVRFLAASCVVLWFAAFIASEKMAGAAL
jgi:hypothetical protein